MKTKFDLSFLGKQKHEVEVEREGEEEEGEEEGEESQRNVWILVRILYGFLYTCMYSISPIFLIFLSIYIKYSLFGRPENLGNCDRKGLVYML